VVLFVEVLAPSEIVLPWKVLLFPIFVSGGLGKLVVPTLPLPLLLWLWGCRSLCGCLCIFAGRRRCWRKVFG